MFQYRARPLLSTSPLQGNLCLQPQSPTPSPVFVALGAKNRLQPRPEMHMAARTLGPRRETKSPAVAFHPQRNRFLIGLIIQPNQHAAAAGLRKPDVGNRSIGVRALGSPVFLEFGERVLRAGMRIRATPHRIGSLII